MGSWPADLFFCCTYNHVPPNFLNISPNCAPLGFCSPLYSTPPFPSGNTTIVSVLPGPHLLVPRLLPGDLPLEHATYCPFCVTHRLASSRLASSRLASPHILYPELPVVAPVLQVLAAEQSSPSGVSWQPMPQSITRLLAAHPVNP